MAKILGVDLVDNHLLLAEVESGKSASNLATVASEHNFALVAEVGGRKSTVVKVLAVDLPLELNPQNAPQLGQWLREQLSAANLTAKDAVCTLGRDRVTLRSVEMPVCPESELPGMVAFEVEDSWNQPGIEPVIDFEAGPAGDLGREVIVALASQPLVNAIAEMLSVAGLQCHHIILRPHATHFAWQSFAEEQNGNILFAVPGDEKCDLSIWQGDQLAGCRSLSLGTHADATQRVVSEIRRTIVSHHSHFPDAEVDRVVVCAPNHFSLAEALRESLGIPVDRFDLTQHLKVVGGQLSAGMVAAFGAALHQQTKQSWPIDLLNPKKPEVVRDRTKSVGIMALVLLAMLPIGIVFYAKKKLGEKTEQIAFYAQQLNDLNDQLSKMQPMLKRHDAIMNWTTGPINWLEEMQELAARLPDTSEMYLTQLDMATGRSAAPNMIRVDGRAREQSLWTDRVMQLAKQESPHYSVNVGPPRPVEDSLGFQWSFRGDAELQPFESNQYAALIAGWRSSLAGLTPKDGLKRVPVELATTRTAKPSPSVARTEPKATAETSTAEAEKTPEPSATAEGKSVPKSGGDAASKDDMPLEDRLKAMTYEQREAYIKGLPSEFLKNITRRKIKELGL